MGPVCGRAKANLPSNTSFHSSCVAGVDNAFEGSRVPDGLLLQLQVPPMGKEKGRPTIGLPKQVIGIFRSVFGRQIPPFIIFELNGERRGQSASVQIPASLNEQFS